MAVLLTQCTAGPGIQNCSINLLRQQVSVKLVTRVRAQGQAQRRRLSVGCMHLCESANAALLRHKRHFLIAPN